jgi:hypothetical protein
VCVCVCVLSHPDRSPKSDSAHSLQTLPTTPLAPACISSKLGTVSVVNQVQLRLDICCGKKEGEMDQERGEREVIELEVQRCATTQKSKRDSNVYSAMYVDTQTYTYTHTSFPTDTHTSP